MIGFLFSFLVYFVILSLTLCCSVTFPHRPFISRSRACSGCPLLSLLCIAVLIMVTRITAFLSSFFSTFSVPELKAYSQGALITRSELNRSKDSSLYLFSLHWSSTDGLIASFFSQHTIIWWQTEYLRGCGRIFPNTLLTSTSEE